ncbi:MAG: hypothetical protein R3293_17720 [Candidatus Promineifilaceae bacterium]|nr:hypothetical protein [Candidatus Promineifilaceae bacterium]
MERFRKITWLILLIIILATFVSLSVAQESATSSNAQIFSHASTRSNIIEPLAWSLTESQTELTASSRISRMVSADSIRISPESTEVTSLQLLDLIGSTGLPLPEDLLSPLKKTSGPAVPDNSAGNEPVLKLSDHFVDLPGPKSVNSPGAAAACEQLLGNTQLTWDEGTSTFLPWVILDPIVYYSTGNHTSAPHSTVLVDADAGDPNPGQDAFAQVFAMPPNLTQVRIEYNTASLTSNAADLTFGNLWTVDSNGNLDQFIVSWSIGPSEGVWQSRFVEFTNSSDLQALQDKNIAIIIFNQTDGIAPGETVFFDDITLTACYEDIGEIIIEKQTDPPGSPQKFKFQASWLGDGSEAYDFELSHGQSHQSGALSSGTYSVSELPVAGWNQTSATCDDGSSPGSISLQAGETVTCTFQNAQVNDSYIIVMKQSSPAGSSQKFEFQASWTGASFELSDGQSIQSPALSPGTYSVSELPVSGWKLVGATCNDGSNPASISLQAGETVICVFQNVKTTCDQLLANTTIDIVEFGDGTGTAEPWSVIFPIVYFTDDPNLAYDGYSLILEDGDDGDPDPNIDMFAQGFVMPEDLTEISVEYFRAMLDSNVNDEAFGELWLLDDDWVLHLDDPGQYFVGSWTVTESEAVWARESIFSNDPAFLNKMAGKKMAILLFNITDGGGATEAEKEWVLFDNVNLYACTQPRSEVFLPTILNKYGIPVEVDPICTPPSENPFDQWNSHRGFVQTDAICTSTLSNVDIADYYAFTPTESGDHTLSLTNLPPNTEWSAMIFFDTPSPSYVPGPTPPENYCRIGTPGAVDKQVTCHLDKNVPLFVKVSAGSTPVPGQYTMSISGP